MPLQALEPEGPPARDLLVRCTFPPAGTAVACAVSGGADSLALLVLAVDAGLAVTAIHVDHGLREGSADEADVVRCAAAAVGARFEARAVVVGAGPNLEARARRARYAALPAGVLTGHTADDQAETLLLNLMRGAGLHGLAGMRPGDRRPILALRRVETEALCARRGLAPVADPSNADPTILRNRVRAELLPLLTELAGRDVVPLLCRTASVARESTDHLDLEAALLDPTDARALAGAPAVIAALAVRTWLRQAAHELHPPDRATLERVLAVARGEAVATDVGDGLEVRRSSGRLALRRLGDAPGAAHP